MSVTAAAGTSLARAGLLAEELHGQARFMELFAAARRMEALLRRIGDVAESIDDVVRSAEGACHSASRVGGDSVAQFVRQSVISRPRPERLGALGGTFRSGVRDPWNRLNDQERKAIRRIAGPAADVLVLREDHSLFRVQTPDVVVRHSSLDPGTATEIKTLDNASDVSVKRNMIRGAEQLSGYGGGDVVIDGRDVGLTEATARKGCARAAGQARAHGQRLPRKTVFLLRGNQVLTVREEEIA